MNAKLFLTSLFGLAALLTPASLADTVAGTPDASVQHVSNKVGAALGALPLLNEVQPDTSARYYIYLCSAGWCGPCNREMPRVVEAYKEMKKSGVVELVLVDYDHSEEDARAFMNKYGVNFPATMKDKGQQLPGFVAPRGIPSAIFVSADGSVITRGHGSAVQRWQEIISEYEKQNHLQLSFPESLTLSYSPVRTLAEVEDDETDAPESTHANKVYEGLKSLKWFNGKPSKKAQYYIYLQSASWCGPCRAEMPDIAREYKAMKKDGRVELVLLGGDRSVGAAKSFLKDNKAKFPGTMRAAKGVSELPGAKELPNYFPAAVIVRADGTVVTSGHGSLVKKWRSFTIDKEEAGDDHSPEKD